MEAWARRYARLYWALDAVGPRVFGARTSANVEVDFAGGSPTTAYGVASGLVRLRTAEVSLDWEKTSLRIGQDAPFFSPLSPTSYATLLEPGMAWSGNLWVWTPEIEVEHRITLASRSNLVLQGGLLDPLTEEFPPFQGRNPTAGEATRIRHLPEGSPSIVPTQTVTRSRLDLAAMALASNTRHSIRLIAGR